MTMNKQRMLETQIIIAFCTLADHDYVGTQADEPARSLIRLCQQLEAHHGAPEGPPPDFHYCLRLAGIIAVGDILRNVRP